MLAIWPSTLDWGVQGKCSRKLYVKENKMIKTKLLVTKMKQECRNINENLMKKNTWLKKDCWKLLVWIPIVRNWLPVNKTENKTRVQILTQANFAKLNDGCPTLKIKTQMWNWITIQISVSEYEIWMPEFLIRTVLATRLAKSL